MNNTTLTDETCLSARNVSKKFCKNLRRSMYYGITDITKSMIGIKPVTQKLKKHEFWALSDISFGLRKGDILGVIGANGSGKTTLLRILAGIFPLDKGEVFIKGQVASLLSIQAGFHPHMSVLENIYLNGTIYGLTKEEIDAKLGFIIEFSDLKDFIKAPTAVLSAGMFVRLSFSIALAIKPDIFLIDEVLALADKNFREKYLDEIIKLSSDMAIVFVSHNMEIVDKICNRIIVMDRGIIMSEGRNVKSGIDCYSSIRNGT
jgi:lipopolysaccharide transport system ATP-binding protein